MNIFATDECPVKSAQYLDTKRQLKMIVESAQLLSTTLHFYHVEAPYQPSHVNHPITRWVRESDSNYLWLVRHMEALCREYTRKYHKIHKCEQYIEYFKMMSDKVQKGSLNKFCNCAANKSLGISFKHIDDVCKAYRLYLKERNKNEN